jgi:hypothetical protein
LQRNPETGEEPDCIALWEIAHNNNGEWTIPESKILREYTDLEAILKTYVLLFILDVFSSDGSVLFIIRTKQVKTLKTD